MIDEETKKKAEQYDRLYDSEPIKKEHKENKKKVDWPIRNLIVIAVYWITAIIWYELMYEASVFDSRIDRLLGWGLGVALTYVAVASILMLVIVVVCPECPSRVQDK